jgi:proline iminopeptidase
MLDIGDGFSMYYEEHGSKTGKSVVILHGGPGGGLQRSHMKVFDLKKWHIILFDQRGCGKSTPRGIESLRANTTWDLVRDMEILRNHLGLESWTIFGGSWGTTLGLAYAEAYPTRVDAMILRGVCLMQQWEQEWLYKGGIATVWPEAWMAFKRGSNTMKSYTSLLRNKKTRRKAAKTWWDFESSISFLEPHRDTTPAKTVEELALLEHHYFKHEAWLKPGQLLRKAYLLKKIPIVIVQGRYDMVCPFRAAWELKQQLPHIKLVVVPAGHAHSEPAIKSALKEEIAKLC